MISLGAGERKVIAVLLTSDDFTDSSARAGVARAEQRDTIARRSTTKNNRNAISHFYLPLVLSNELNTLVKPAEFKLSRL